MGDRDILLAYDYDPDFKPPNLTWKDLLEDAKIDCAGKSIEDTGEPGGGIFCAVCITYCEGGTRVEDGDLTTHLRSETREIEMFGKFAKTLFDGELRLAYKWGAYPVMTVEHSLSSLSSCAYTCMIYKTIPASLAIRGQQSSSHP
ncbi:unnamed protein product [Brassica napus]|uniref:(rape) hypothetical protein n=1 Tax=Brassica napus TaxID=3708 RepID=A0A816QK47_BRANA|nr:unnamed protein product [Brassica napus]